MAFRVIFSHSYNRSWQRLYAFILPGKPRSGARRELEALRTCVTRDQELALQNDRRPQRDLCSR